MSVALIAIIFELFSMNITNAEDQRPAPRRVACRGCAFAPAEHRVQKRRAFTWSPCECASRARQMGVRADSWLGRVVELNFARGGCSDVERGEQQPL